MSNSMDSDASDNRGWIGWNRSNCGWVPPVSFHHVDEPMPQIVRRYKKKTYIALKWTISEKRLIELKEGVDENPLSNDLKTVPTYKNLKYGLNLACGEHAVLTLHFENLPEREIQSKLIFSIESANYYFETAQIFNAENNSISFPICLFDLIFDPNHNFIVDGKMIIQCEGMLVKDNLCHQQLPRIGMYDASISEPNEELIGLWEDEESKARAVIVDGKTIYCHKAVFLHMFANSYAGFQHVYVSDFSYDIMKLIVKLHYHPCLVYPLSIEQMIHVLRFQKKYGSIFNYSTFADAIIKEIRQSTVVRLANYALEFKISNLSIYCEEFMLACLKSRETCPIASFDELNPRIKLRLFERSLINSSTAKWLKDPKHPEKDVMNYSGQGSWLFKY